MPDVRIRHVIYTRVEKMYSPHQQNGYQIVYQSPGLGAETVQIEKYIQCFQTNKQQMDRHQFFWTENGQAIMTRSVSLLSPHREVIDRNQRDAFLAHAIIMDKEEFANVRNDPFALFEAAEERQIFARDVEQLVYYLKEVPPAEQISIPLRNQLSHLPDEWTNADMQNLYRLGEEARTLSEQKKSLLLITTSPGEVFKLLSYVLFLLPAHERPACTFDTFIDSCTPSAGTFWAIGGTKQINTSNFVSLHLAERKRAIFTSSSISTYSTWLAYVLQKYETFGPVNEELYSAQVVAEALSAKRALPTEPLDEEALRTFYQVNRQFIESCVQKVLISLVDRTIAEAIAPFFCSHLSSTSILSVAAQETFSVRELARLIYYWLLKEQPVFKGWDSLLKFAERAGYMPLQLLASLKARPPFLFGNYEKLQAQAVKELLGAGKLPRVLYEIVGYRPVKASTGDGKEVQLKTFELGDEEFQMLVNALLQNDAGNMLGTLFTERVSLLQSKKVVTALARAVAAGQNVPPEFVRTLSQHPLYPESKS